jgi:hypothetical protein
VRPQDSPLLLPTEILRTTSVRTAVVWNSSGQQAPRGEQGRHSIMTNAVIHATKGLAVVLATLLETFLKTPLWVWLSYHRQKTSKECPNGIQKFLTLAAKSFLYWLTKMGARPALNTRTPSRLRDWLLCRKFTWIAPASTNRKDAGYSFDSAMLPVPLTPSEATKRIAGLWFLNPREPAPAMPLGARRESPVVLYFRECSECPILAIGAHPFVLFLSRLQMGVHSSRSRLATYSWASLLPE